MEHYTDNIYVYNDKTYIYIVDKNVEVTYEDGNRDYTLTIIEDGYEDNPIVVKDEEASKEEKVKEEDTEEGSKEEKVEEEDAEQNSEEEKKKKKMRKRAPTRENEEDDVDIYQNMEIQDDISVMNNEDYVRDLYVTEWITENVQIN